MIKDETTPLVIEIAKSFVMLVKEENPTWSNAYFRFSSQDDVCEAKGSYAVANEVTILNVLKHKNFFHAINDKGQELLNLLGKTQGVFLLVVDSSFEYEIKFEYNDMNRWKISKVDGGTGIPEGL